MTIDRHYRDARREVGLPVWEATETDTDGRVWEWEATLGGFVTLKVTRGTRPFTFTAEAYFGEGGMDLDVLATMPGAAKVDAVEWAVADLAKANRDEAAMLEDMASDQSG